MVDSHLYVIAGELGIQRAQVGAAASLFAEGCTVPFIARYRKEATGSLDEVAITAIRDRLAQLTELDRRREAMVGSLEERELLTDELASRLRGAGSLTALEDIYLPFRPKRRTRATIARERGLEPLADLIQAQDPSTASERVAAAFVNSEQGVESVAEALKGARDIIAERVSEDEATRVEMRKLFRQRGELSSKLRRGKEAAGAKFRDYFDSVEPAARAAGHRILAMRRGESEEILTLRALPPEEEALRLLERRFLRGKSPASAEMSAALADGYRRLLSPAMETELRLELKRRAEAEAIDVFARNLRELLLASPLGPQRLLALDPGFRTGCKLVCLGAGGELLHHDTVYPHTGGAKAEAAGRTIHRLVAEHEIEALAVGNGTAGRETETWLRSLDLPEALPVIMVDESGASIYSASPAARREFPDHDLTVRGAVSIGRRLQDPLAELVKLDPKSIGVGQYQHDVDQRDLKQSLVDMVVSCVNLVGVDLNTASEELLTYVSGLGPGLAANIVARRRELGPFRRRRELLKVPRLGPKAFEQAAGFLRIRDAADPLDASAVHPERYALVKRMAVDLDCNVADLLADAELRERVELDAYTGVEVGLPTLRDIMAELAKPGRDPRDAFEFFQFAPGVNAIDDLREGMRLPGLVTNVTDFGAFVDIGVHQDGLVHISQLADRFVKHPGDVVKVRQQVLATVISVDLERRRIALSLKSGA